MYTWCKCSYIIHSINSQNTTIINLILAIDDCDPNPCLNGGDCTDGINSFTCECEDGYSGDTCQMNIDDCDPNPCLNGGSCNDGVNMFTCDCALDFTGVTCETGESKNVLS